MSRNVRPAIAVAALLVLAGCGGGLSGDSSQATSTESAPAATPDRNLSEVRFPEGFSRSAVGTETARTRSLSLLRTEPVSAVALERFRPGAYADYRYDANATRVRFRFDVHNGYSDVTENDVYADTDTRHTRQLRNGRLSFDTANGSVAETRRRAAVSLWAVLSRILTVGEFRAVRASGDGDERRIRYAVVGVAARDATDVRGYVIVDDDGAVRTARLLYSQDGEPKRFQYTVHRRSEGVSPPAWLPAADATAGDGEGVVAARVGPADSDPATVGEPAPTPGRRG